MSILGKIKSRSQVIFATGDNLRIVTVTANTGFLRAAAGQVEDKERDFIIRVATKIFEDFGGALNISISFIRGREPVSIIHYTRPGTCINRPLH